MVKLNNLTEFIINAYVDSKMSIKEIGTLFNVSERPIKRILEGNGVEIRKRGPVKGHRRGNFDMLLEYTK